MKKLGLIGGMGPESTLPYYHDIVYGVKEKTGQYPLLTIESVNVFDILRFCGERRYDDLTHYLLRATRNLAAAGADFAALSANTPHIVFDRLKAASPLPLVSIIEAARDEAVAMGFQRIGLLGTIFTMTEDFFRKPFEESGISILVPSEQEMAFLHEKISTELELGIVKPETLSSFQSIINRMKSENEIEAIILGCTELPLLLNDKVCPVPCLDTMQIHVKALVNQIISD